MHYIINVNPQTYAKRFYSPFWGQVIRIHASPKQNYIQILLNGGIIWIKLLKWICKTQNVTLLDIIKTNIRRTQNAPDINTLK